MLVLYEIVWDRIVLEWSTFITLTLWQNIMNQIFVSCTMEYETRFSWNVRYIFAVAKTIEPNLVKWAVFLDINICSLLWICFCWLTLDRFASYMLWKSLKIVLQTKLKIPHITCRILIFHCFLLMEYGSGISIIPQMTFHLTRTDTHTTRYFWSHTNV